MIFPAIGENLKVVRWKICWIFLWGRGMYVYGFFENVYKCNQPKKIRERPWGYIEIGVWKRVFLPSQLVVPPTYYSKKNKQIKKFTRIICQGWLLFSLFMFYYKVFLVMVKKWKKKLVLKSSGCSNNIRKRVKE